MWCLNNELVLGLGLGLGLDLVLTLLILLTASSVHLLQIRVSACELRLRQLDLAINVRKRVFIRTGPWCHSSCLPLVMSDASQLQTVDKVRYLGVTVIRCTHFRVILTMPKIVSQEL